MRRRALGGLLLFPGWARARGFQARFALTDGGGHNVTVSDYRGSFLLVMFGYTSCPDVCPDTLYKIARALHLMNGAASVWRAVFITVDPVHDTPALTARYAALFSSRITGLSGTPAQVQNAVAAFDVYVGPRDPHTGAIAHSALLYVLNPAGNLTAVLPDGLSATQLAGQLAKLSAP